MTGPPSTELRNRASGLGPSMLGNSNVGRVP